MPQFTPDTLAFPDVPLRRTSDWQSVELANRGTGLLRISDVMPSPDFECASLHPPILDPGTSCTLVVRIRPRSPGLIAGDVQVVDDAAGSPHAVLCSGTGLATPLLVAEPQGASFGGQPVGTSGETRPMRFTNDGTTVMNVTSVDVIGAQAGDFIVAPGTLPAAVPPEGHCLVEVGIRPAVTGVRSALLRVTSDAYQSPHLFPLDGFGSPPPAMTIDPTVLTFPPGPVGSPSTGRRVTLVNNDQTPIPIASVEVLGAEFTVRGGDLVPGAVVPVGGSCGVDLVVTPAAAGRRTGQLRIEATGGDVATAELTATGVGAELAFDPPDTDFGAWLAGGLTDLREVRLTNEGNAPVRVNTLAVMGDFVSAGTCAGSVLGPTGYCTIRLRMQAAAVGPRTGRIVASGDGGLEAVATLRGVGAAPVAGLDPDSVTFPARRRGDCERSGNDHAHRHRHVATDPPQHRPARSGRRRLRPRADRRWRGTPARADRRDPGVLRAQCGGRADGGPGVRVQRRGERPPRPADRHRHHFCHATRTLTGHPSPAAELTGTLSGFPGRSA